MFHEKVTKKYKFLRFITPDSVLILSINLTKSIDNPQYFCPQSIE